MSLTPTSFDRKASEFNFLIPPAPRHEPHPKKDRAHLFIAVLSLAVAIVGLLYTMHVLSPF